MDGTKDGRGPEERGVDERIRSLGADYNRPPETPREEMWEAIRGRLDAEPRAGADVVDLGVRRRRVGRALAWAAAAGVVLLLGVGIGRMTAPPDGAGPSVAGGEVPSADGEVMRWAATEHLARTEALLAVVRTDARAGRVDPVVGRWGRELLAETRLLMDSDAGADPALRELLEDLELVLVQVALLAGEDAVDDDRSREELDLLVRGMDDSGVITRIQAAVPTAPGLAGT